MTVSAEIFFSTIFFERETEKGKQRDGKDFFLTYLVFMYLCSRERKGSKNNKSIHFHYHDAYSQSIVGAK